MKRLLWLAVLCLTLAGAQAAPVLNAANLRAPVTVTVADRAAYTHALPTGRLVSPVGTVTGTPNFPTGIAVLGDRVAVLANGATRTQSVSIFAAGTLSRLATILAYPRGIKAGQRAARALAIADQDFFQGLAAGPQGMLYAAGGNADDVLAISLAGGAPRVVRRYRLTWQAFPAGQYPYRYAGPSSARPRHFYPDAIALGPYGRHLWVCGLLSNALARVDLTTGTIAYLNVGSYPNALAFADGGRRLVVSLWGENAVAVVDARELRLVGRVPLGPRDAPRASAPGIHPIALAADPDSSRVFVALANVDRVAEIDAATLARVRLLDDAPYRGAPPGSYPDALALAGGRLYVANAGNDDVAVFNAASGARLGAVPTAWYPTAVVAGPRALYVVAAKGLGAGPNLRHQWVGDMMHGVLQRVALPLSAQELARDTAQALGNDRLLAAQRAANDARNARLSQELRRKIRTVVLILRENKTFDQDFGGYPGLGAWADPHLAMYGRAELPNLYALAGSGTLFTDFDVDGEVTAQGHQWTTAASDSDFVQRTWPAYYSDRGLVENPGWTDPLGSPDTAHGKIPLGFDDPYGDDRSLSQLGAWSNPWISYPAGRFLFDDLSAHGVSFENFGEFISRTEGGDVLPGVLAHTDANFPGWNRFLLDTGRARFAIDWIDAHREDFPRFLYIWLPDDHTAGGAPCYYTPDYYVADNDAATGRVVAALSHLPAWRHMAVFITEDDAQSGADHVDAHRSFLVAAGPWVERGEIETSPYSQIDMIRTAEAILGIPPLSQWDANARVIAGIWRTTPDDAPFQALPMRVTRAVNPGRCSRYTLLRRRAGETGSILTRAWLTSHANDLDAAAPASAAQAYTPTSLLKVSGPEQLRQEWIATHGLAGYRRLQAYLAALAARRHEPLRALIANDGD